MLTKRMKLSIAIGVILGVFCILGALIRTGFQVEATYLFALWYNRLVMGIMIGLAGKCLNLSKAIVRGAILGFIVSFAFYTSVGFDDLVSFLAGIIYGVIIETIAFKYGE